ncbi:copper-containing nitrite reductase [Massilia sp. NR 4-1]|uniref:copper-containing nitrite reductase n=1 Tax=Massilia sp. NR 4-1 TaxID=1678028 RepID=UPI00067C6EEC|nr:copper-containing nitrite reductase [Massilia sp. NR 4-1]AKU20529.1 hypothetical protein ACZ75_02345 [Massilia sp. NR 4-1]
MKKKYGIAPAMFACLAGAFAMAPIAVQAAPELPIVQHELVAPPKVPPRITRKTPARVVVHMTVEEFEKEIAPGTKYTFWTFGGTVPGKMIRVREGDTVELHLKNLAENKLPHNIDLHAVTGPGGGAERTLIAPGNEAIFTFKALNPGLYVYHCATAPVAMHIANGMYGMILVEPKEGMAPVDKEYYVMQGDFYTAGNYRAPGLQAFDMQKSIDEKPTYVLFNGADGALTGENSLTANTDEKIRMFFGVGGPNITSSFHIIGAIFDKVYLEGGKNFQENVQTTMVPAGGATIAEFKTKVPGNLTLVDHSLSRAFHKGAIGLLKVTGPDRPEVFGPSVKRPLTESTVNKTEPAAKPAPQAAKPAAAAPASAAAKPQQHARGKAVYEANCAACHQADGKGVDGVFPPLANSDFVQQRPDELAAIISQGRSGELVVNGKRYNGVMPPQDLNDEDVASVINYISVGMNRGKEVATADQVRSQRKAKVQ